MSVYIFRRILIAIPVLIALSIGIFIIMRIVPGDVLVSIVGPEGAGGLTTENREKLLADLDLDKPLVVQYGKWTFNLLQGRLGESFWRGEDIRALVIRRAPATLEIAVLAVGLSWLIGLPVGMIGGIRQDSWADYVSRILTITFASIPAFWTGVLILVVCLVVFGWRPPLQYFPLWENPIANLQMVFFPALVLGLNASAYIARMTRSSVLEVLREDYVRTAHAKGLWPMPILTRHVLKNALIPVMTVSSVTFGYLISGSVVVETVFNVPGLGMTLLRGFIDRDYMVIQNLVLIYGFGFVLVNLFVDIAYGWADPRVRYS